MPFRLVLCVSMVALTGGSAQTLVQDGSSRPGECRGIHVTPLDDLIAEVDAAPRGATICIGAGVHEIGSRSLVPKSGMTLQGVPAVVGMDGSVGAPSRIHGGGTAVIVFESRAVGVTIRNLDISGAVGTKTRSEETKSHGRGIDGGSGNAVDLLVHRSRIHHNSSLGIGGAGGTLTIRQVELDNNGSESYLTCCSGGVKSVNPLRVTGSYIHDNVGAGIWQDVCGTDLIVEDNRIFDNSRWGVRYEHSSDCDGTATIVDNKIVGNNYIDASSDSGGIIINSAPGAEVAFNSLRDNGPFAISVHGSRGPVTGTYVHHNVIGGGELAGCDADGVRCETNVVLHMPE